MEGALIVNYISPIGTLQARFNDRGLYRLGLRSNMDEEKEPFGDPCDPRWTALKERLDDYFLGEELDPAGVELDLSSTSEFSKDVYKELVKVPHGEVITYGDLAREAGYPGGARAVGRAMNSNPFLLLVPCHRVVARGSRGGHSIGGFGIGTEIKQTLLSLEGSIDRIG
ncbi:MAG: methylated-DNA--[protein]-cysteine S-methyltransferase [Thermoplasmata archaeon]|nr:methylated-DNA--[protein]-cysteine S-methyltransferase [Thermoplasmata archaeon]